MLRVVRRWGGGAGKSVRQTLLVEHLGEGRGGEGGEGRGGEGWGGDLYKPETCLPRALS